MSVSAEKYARKDMSFWEKVWDNYFSKALLYDFIMAILVVLVNLLLVNNSLSIGLQIDDVKEFYNILLSAILPLVGFIFTAITIIITIKGLVHKTNKPSNIDGVEIFFNSPKYGDLIKVLRTVMWEFFIIFLLLLFLKPILSYFSGQWIINTVIFLVVLMGLGLARTLVLFHLVIDMIGGSKLE